MKDPPHPGELVADSLEDLGWTISDAAKGLGLSRQQLHNVIAGRSAISPALAVKLERAIGSTADTWLAMQNAHDVARERAEGSAGGVERFARK